MMKDSGLNIVYWPELINTANYLRNCQPVTEREMTPYKANVGRKPQLGHLRRIRQVGYAQVQKPNTGWKKFQDRVIRCVLLGYEGDHIYRMLTPDNKVLTFSNVKWIDNTIPYVLPLEPFKHQRLLPLTTLITPITPIQENNNSDDLSIIPILTEIIPNTQDKSSQAVSPPTLPLSSVPPSISSRLPSIPSQASVIPL